MIMAPLKAPFPYFGGKASVAPDVWQALGDVKRYIEPFFGSGAVLLQRPDFAGDANQYEIVNDADGFVANVWRGIQLAPDEVAKWCDWPVNHADLMARKADLLRNKERLLDGLVADPQWCDPVLAGYWVWAASCWIGGGLTRPGSVPELTQNGGVHGKVPLLDHSRGVHTSSTVYDWMRALSERLRRVKVVCGDWSRVCGGNWQDGNATCGMFFDPPYSDAADRDESIYDVESLTVAHDVRTWCLKRGDSPTMRIVLAGYYDEHCSLLEHGWTVKRWKAQGGYGNRAEGRGKENRRKEALFFSPHCIKEKSMFD